MSMMKRLIAAAVSGIIAAASVTAAMPVVSYAATVDYNSRDYVWDYDYTLFFEHGIEADLYEDELNRKFIYALEKATGVNDYAYITFGDLEKVTSLNLGGMGLEGIPRIIEYMPRLRTLNLSDNRLLSTYVRNLDLSGCISLTSLDISRNYLTSVPSWYVALDIPTKKIDNNLLSTSDQRHITVSPDTFYFMVGDTLDENEFKDKVLSTLMLSDGTYLPPYFFDPELPTYDVPSTGSNGSAILRNENVEFDIKLSNFIDSSHKVTKTGSVTGEISLFALSAAANKNIRTNVTVYFLDGDSPSSVKIRLETLISECEKLTKDNYTAASWSAFEAALKSAKTIIGYANADTDMLKRELDSLTARRDALIGGVSSATKKVLTDLIAVAKTFKESDWTAQSWKAFAKALEMLTAAAENADTSIIEANEAIKAYQDALSGLTATSISVPSKVSKSEFDAIYGEDKDIAYRGVTRGGYEYSWVFNGKDVTAPKDFNPEIKYDSDAEEAIRLTVGSASDYQLISFAHKDAFPGMATLTLDVSGTYKNGKYHLYKWDNASKKPEFIKEITIIDGITEFTLSAGGDYFISSVLQNFQMISSNFDIDHNKLTITGKFKKKYTVTEFRNSLENGNAVLVLNADGTSVYENEYIATGMTASAPNSDVAYVIIVPGDIDGDGNITALDAVTLLRAVVGEITLDTYAQRAASDITGDGWVRADDAVAILKYCIGIE